MESIHVSFDDKRITCLEDTDDHDQLRFGNEVPLAQILNTDTLANLDGPNSDSLLDFNEPLFTEKNHTSNSKAYVEHYNK